MLKSCTTTDFFCFKLNKHVNVDFCWYMLTQIKHQIKKWNSFNQLLPERLEKISQKLNCSNQKNKCNDCEKWMCKQKKLLKN